MFRLGPALLIGLLVTAHSLGVDAQDILDAHEIERRVGPSVVFVSAYQGGGSSTEGTGVLVTSNGWVITNQHVLADSDDVVVWVPGVPDFTRFEALIVVADGRRDLALLRIDATELVAAELAPPEALQPGTAVASLGYPEGIFTSNRQMRIVPGVVSHTRFPLGDLAGRRWIVSDVKLREGNSGGPLVDARGRVVGINTIRRLDGETSLSIPVDELYAILAELLALREQATETFRGDVEHVRRELRQRRLSLQSASAQIGQVTGPLVARQLDDAERLISAATTSFMTGHWVLARVQMHGAMQAMRWLRGVLGN